MNANIQVVVDEDDIRQRIREEINKQIELEVMYIDIKRLEGIFSMKSRFLEENLLSHPSVKMWERRNSRKRFWKAPETLNAISEIIENSW